MVVSFSPFPLPANWAGYPTTSTRDGTFRRRQRHIGMKLNNREGLAEIHAAFYPRLVGELTVVAGSRASAEDCANEAFTRLVLHWNKVSKYDSPVAWLRTVGYRLAVDEQRRSRRQLATSDPEPAPSHIDDHPYQHEIWQAIRDLPASQREVVVRRAVHDLTDAEIAEELAVPIGTVKSRLSRARTTLRSHLGEPS